MSCLASSFARTADTDWAAGGEREEAEDSRGKGEDVRLKLLSLGHLQSGWQPNLTDTWGWMGMGF
jgi:hypothetical protein